ncbi:thiol reductant ABC exporter subunit CydD [Polycladidibacter stylochi]|uniref:thiol reductant ABC exporter subunit CydD n=1 Tax=Polycladidibacter stylochi TaxID=1807766 RepID=UPI000836705B|nr:thiol reductant ABC exporter subunit CydD [Pseudovibrio stylochi]
MTTINKQQQTIVDNQNMPKKKKRKRKQSVGSSWLQTAIAPEKTAISHSSYLHAASELLWVAQAAALAYAINWLMSEHQGLKVAILATLVIIVISGIRAYLRLKADHIAIVAAARTRQTLQEKLLSRISGVSPATPLPASGKFASLAVEHIQAIGPYIAKYLPIERRLILVPLGFLIAIASVSWFVALLLIVLAPLVPLAMALVGIKAKRASEQQLGILADMSAFLLDRLRGLETLQIFGAIKTTEADMDRFANQFRASTMKVLRIAFLSSTSLELFSALGLALAAIYAGFSLLGYWSFGSYGVELNLGTSLFILLLVPEFFAPLRLFAQAYHDRAAAIAAAELLAKADDTPNNQTTVKAQPLQPPSNIDLSVQGKLIIENLGFSRDSKTILDKVSFQMDGPELVVITGESGAGKSTLLDVLQKFITPDSGTIKYAEKDLKHLDHSLWQKSIAVVSQSPKLFHGTLRSNLHLANRAASDEQMIAALKEAHAGQLIEKIQGGLSGGIGEEGLGLSMGERRRFAIARAAIRDDALIILADEPTADLDGYTAQQVLSSLVKLSKRKPVLVATHDKSVCERADRLYELIDGQLITKQTNKKTKFLSKSGGEEQ